MRANDFPQAVNLDTTFSQKLELEDARLDVGLDFEDSQRIWAIPPRLLPMFDRTSPTLYVFAGLSIVGFGGVTRSARRENRVIDHIGELEVVRSKSTKHK